MTPRACLFALLVILCADAHALEAPANYRYRIHHQMFGEIGEHRMSVRQEGADILVEHDAELAVEMLGLTAFHRRTRFREVWRDDRLIEFDGLIEDNGEPFPVSARAAGDYLIIEGSAGRIEAPPDTVPSEPSLERAIRREWFFDSKTGALLDATVTPAGREPLKVGDGVVEASRYEITGDLEQHVWFDAAGVWGAVAPVAPGCRRHAHARVAHAAAAARSEPWRHLNDARLRRQPQPRIWWQAWRLRHSVDFAAAIAA